MAQQLHFLEDVPLPPGFSYHPDFISVEEEKELLENIRSLEFSSFEMRGVEARRKIISYGRKYDFRTRTATKSASLPEWLLPLKLRSENFLKKEISQILVTHYPEHAPIGWHIDAPAFESLLGISLLNDCRFLLRKGEAGRWEKFEQILKPRSAYVVKDESRWEWQHHIPPVKKERYSITLRTML